MYGIEERLSKDGYSLSIFSVEVDSSNFPSILNDIKDGMYDGILLGVLQKEFIEELFKVGLPIVSLNEYSFIKDLHYVTINNSLGGKIAAKYLLDKNHKDIGIIYFDIQQINNFLERRNGFYEVLAQNGIDLSFELKVPPPPKLEIIGSFLEENKKVLLSNKITAIFSAIDIISMYLFSFFDKYRVNIPKDLSIISFDNSMYCEFLKPKLTSIDHHHKKLGYSAADLLLSKVSKNRYYSKKIILEPNIVERESIIKKIDILRRWGIYKNIF